MQPCPLRLRPVSRRGLMALGAASAILARGAAAQALPLTAIDILIEPGPEMLRRAEAANARLRGVYPAGFGLDATHRPHITLLQAFVPTAALDRVNAATAAVLATERPAAWTLRGVRYYFLPMGDLGAAGIVVETSEDLRRLHAKVVEAVAPFIAPDGTAAAFATTPEAPGVTRPTIDYVTTFVDQAAGPRFNPHVTIGVAPQAYLRGMLAEPFEAFEFGVAGVATYQLGDLGTARRKLHDFALQR